MYRYRQDPPFCVQIELVEGCNLRCPFCAISSIRTKAPEYKYLTLENAARIAGKIALTEWNCRLEFAMHGEPTMNPKWLSIINIFRKMLPKNFFIMESNGAGFMKHTQSRLIAAFNAGIDNLAIEDYENVHFCEKIRPIALRLRNTLAERMNVSIFEYPKENEGNPHQKAGYRKLTFIEDLLKADKGTHSKVHNSAGLAYEKEECGARCAKPFREMAIRWDGNVSLCCNDWRGTYKVDNVLETDLESLWQSDEFQAARLKLYHGERDFGPCEGCNAKSYRVGLLPDKYGKKELPRVDGEGLAIIELALSGKPFTKTVKREWELVQIK